MQPDEPHQGLDGGGFVDLMVWVVVVAAGVLQLPGDLVGGVVGEHVEDEPLLDGLLHRVQVEWLGQRAAVRDAAEQFEGLGLRGGGEREVRDVRRVRGDLHRPL